MSRQRVITSPVRLTGSVHPEQLSALVCVDALKRRRLFLEGDEVIWELSTLAGDAAVQRAVQRAVIREGDDPEEMGRDNFVARARRLEKEAEIGLRNLMTSLEMSPEMDRWGAGSEDAFRAARVAFVRLYEAGVITRNDTVVDNCPSCESVVDEVDTDVTQVEVELVRLALPISDVFLNFDLAEPELLVGVVAVAIPIESDVDDANILIPLADTEVPIVRVADLEAPRLVIPGHDLWSYELARQLNLPIVEVLDSEGVVRQPGLLEGLGRYAARSAATEQLMVDGHVAAHFSSVSTVKRCYRCATPLVPLFGRHWLLTFRTLVNAAVELIKAGEVEFSPVSAMDRLLTMAEQSGSWVVSQQLWSGQPIPVASCLDCGQTEVSVDFPESCKSCMGTLQAHPDVLDARFIAAITPLAMIGWPQALEDPQETSTTLLVGRSGLDIWALPIAALGLRLGDRIPFQQLIVHQTPIGTSEPGQQIIQEMIEWVNKVGLRLARAALLLGDMDTERAQEIMHLLEQPDRGDQGWAETLERYDKAISALEASEALAVLGQSARDGISDLDIDSWCNLLPPLLG